MAFSYFEHASDPEAHTVQDMRDGLRLAVGEEDITLQHSHDVADAVIGVNPDLLWTNKAVYNATTEITDDDNELPVLYTWFRYGPSVPIPNFLTRNLDPVTMGRYSRDMYKSRNESRISPYEFMQYFRERIRESAYFSDEISMKEFLLTLYEEKAPREFKSLYKLNIKIQQLLADIKDITRYTELTENYVDELWTSFEPIHRRLRSSLYGSGGLERKICDHIINFIHVVKQVLEWMKGREFVSSNEADSLQRIWSCYQRSVWKWPAYKISYLTNDNDRPAAIQFRKHTKDKMRDSKGSWSNNVQNLRQELRDKNIIGTKKSFSGVTINDNPISQIDSAIFDKDTPKASE